MAAIIHWLKLYVISAAIGAWDTSSIAFAWDGSGSWSGMSYPVSVISYSMRLGPSLGLVIPGLG